jgi:hypothetical protein
VEDEIKLIEENQQYWKSKTNEYKLNPEKVELEINGLMNVATKKLDEFGNTIFEVGYKKYRINNGVYQKLEGKEWKTMHGIDQTNFEAILGSKLDNIKFSGTVQEIKQQELLELSKKNDIYQANPKHDPNSKSYGGKDASVEPGHSTSLWNSRRYFDEKTKTWWTIEEDGKNVIYHRFSGGETSGTWHWTGSSNSTNKWGDPVILEKIPQGVKNLVTRK